MHMAAVQPADHADGGTRRVRPGLLTRVPQHEGIGHGVAEGLAVATTCVAVQ